MQRYGKATRRRLRELAAIAYERELDEELAKLYARFKDWRAQKISGFDLSDIIHEFHNGAAQFLTGSPITMSAVDVAAVCRPAPQAVVVAVHFEAVNHCLLTREALRSHLQAAGLMERVRIPADGEVLELTTGTSPAVGIS